MGTGATTIEGASASVGRSDAAEPIRHASMGARHVSIIDHYLSEGSGHEVDRSFRVDDGSPFSMARMIATPEPDPATPDLVVNMALGGPVATSGFDFGRGRFEATTTPGAFVVAPAFTERDYTGDGDYPLQILSIGHDAFVATGAEIVDRDVACPDVLHSRAWSDPAVAWLMHRLWACADEPKAPHSRLVLEGGATMLVGELMRLAGSAPRRPSDRSRLSNPAMNRIDEYLHAHLHESVGVAELATLAGCSRYHFSRLFLATTGQTPHRYLTRLRVERAAMLLTTTSLGVEAIAHRVGFAGARSLVRPFRRDRQATPSEWRRRVGR